MGVEMVCSVSVSAPPPKKSDLVFGEVHRIFAGKVVSYFHQHRAARRANGVAELAEKRSLGFAQIRRELSSGAEPQLSSSANSARAFRPPLC